MSRSPATVAKAWKTLVAGATHADSLVRCEASRFLGELGDRRAVPVLTRQLLTDAHRSKITAVYALGTLGDRKAAPALRRIAADPGIFRFHSMQYHDMVRFAAALELAKWGDGTGVESVRDLLRLPGMLPALFDLAPAIHAAPRNEHLEVMRDKVPLAAIQRSHKGGRGASGRFQALRILAILRDPASRKQIIADLAHFSRYVRVQAAVSLLALEASPAHLALVAKQAKREGTAFARIRFAAILHQHGRGDASAAIRAGLGDADRFIRGTALDAIVDTGLIALVGEAERFLDDEDFYVRSRAAAAIEALAPGRVGELLTQLLADPHPRVVLQAAKSMCAVARR